MARRLVSIGVAPAGDGLKQALKKYVTTDAVVTATNSAKLLAIRDCMADTDYFGVDIECELITYDDLVGRCLLSLNKQKRLSAPAVLLEDLIASVAGDLDEDSLLRGARYQKGLARAVHRSLQSLHQNGVAIREIRESLLADAPGVDLEKLREIADVEEALKQRLDSLNLTFVSDGVRECLEAGSGHSLPLRELIVFVGSSAETLPIRFFQWISECGVPVKLMLDQVEGRADLFQNAERVSRITGAQVSQPDSAWYDVLFTPDRASDAPAVHKIAAGSPQIECEVGVRRLRQRHKAGVAFEEMAIYCRSSDQIPLVESVARMQEVPIRCVRREQLISNGFVQLLISIIESICYNNLSRLIEIGLSSYVREDLSKEEIERIADEAQKAGDRSWQVLNQMVDEAGLSLLWLDALMHWREEVRFSRMRIKEWAESIREFVDASLLIEGVADQVSTTLDRDMGALHSLQFELEAYGVANPEMGAVEMNRFLDILRFVARTGTFLLRSGDSGVTVASNGEELAAYDTVLMLNMVEGSLPRRRSEDAILWDCDLKYLDEAMSLSVPLEDSRDRARAERDEFLRVLSSARHQLILSFSEISNDRENIPTAYIDELVSSTSGKVSSERVLRNLAVGTIDAGAAEEDLTERERTLAIARAMPKLDVQEVKLKSKPAIELASLDKGAIHPSVIQQFLACPFQATMRHRFSIFDGSRNDGIWLLLHAIRESRLSIAEDIEGARAALDSAIGDALDPYRASMDQTRFIALERRVHQMGHALVEREFAARSQWGAKSIECGVQLGDEYGRRKVPVGALGEVEFSGLVFDMREYEKGRLGPLIVYPRLSFPSQERGNAGVCLSGQMFSQLLFLLSYTKGSGAPCIEIDDLFGSRTLVVGGERDTRRTQLSNGLGYQEVRWDKKSGTERTKAVLGLVEDGITRSRSNDMAATPNGYGPDLESKDWVTPPCRRCIYGEHCRVEDSGL